MFADAYTIGTLAVATIKGSGAQHGSPILTAAGHSPGADKYSMVTTALISEDGSDRASPTHTAVIAEETTGETMMKCSEQITAQSEPPTSALMTETAGYITKEDFGVVSKAKTADVAIFDTTLCVMVPAILAARFEDAKVQTSAIPGLGIYS